MLDQLIRQKAVAMEEHPNNPIIAEIDKEIKKVTDEMALCVNSLDT